MKVGSHNFKVRAIAGGILILPRRTATGRSITRLPNTTITSAPPKLTNNPRATFSFISTEEDSIFECSIDAGTFVPCTSPWTSEVLIDGIHTFLVRAIDGAENPDKSAAKAKPWTVDTTPPDTTITPPKTTTSTKVKFKFTATEKKCTFECSLDGAEFTACKRGQSYTELSPGGHTFQVRAIDAAGNPDLTPASFGWTAQ